MHRKKSLRWRAGTFLAILSITIGNLVAGGAFFYSLSAVPVFASTAASVVSPYLYTFNDIGQLQEASSALASTSRYWWVNSGAYLNISGGYGRTIQGALAATDPWRILYAANNPTDTDNGQHPQNIFRLVSRNQWQNARTEAQFYIDRDNLSASPNRNVSNGLLLFNRYQDSQNLYYAGVRVDGAAVIKKKQNSIYTTLAYTSNIFAGTYNHATNPDLIPKNQWMGLRTDVQNQSDGSVRITLYLDRNNNGNWQQMAQATDKSTPITKAGYNGIRTDFMDVTFENFRTTNL